MKAHVSQLVHYIDRADGNHCAAIVVYISDEESQAVNLVQWNAYGAPMSRDTIAHDPTAKIRGTWHSIEAEAEEPFTGQPNIGNGPSSAGDSLPKPDSAAIE